MRKGRSHEGNGLGRMQTSAGERGFILSRHMQHGCVQANLKAISMLQEMVTAEHAGSIDMLTTDCVPAVPKFIRLAFVDTDCTSCCIFTYFICGIVTAEVTSVTCNYMCWFKDLTEISVQMNLVLNTA